MTGSMKVLNQKMLIGSEQSFLAYLFMYQGNKTVTNTLVEMIPRDKRGTDSPSEEENLEPQKGRYEGNPK